MVNGEDKNEKVPEQQAEIQVGITDDFEVIMLVSLPEVVMTADVAMQLGRQFIKTAKEARKEKELNSIAVPDSKILLPH